MWFDVASGHPEYARELFESLTGVPQPTQPVAGSWLILGPGSGGIGRIRPATAGQGRGQVLTIFAVPDVAASLATARALGGTAQAARSMAGEAVYEILDPAGNAFAVTSDRHGEDASPGVWPPGGVFAELVVDDFSQLHDFYAPVLDVTVEVVKLPRLREGMSRPESGYRLLTRAGSVVAGAIESSFFLLGESGLTCLVYLEVPDLDRALVTAVELGCRVLVPPGVSPQGQYAVIEDPDHLPWGLGVTAETPEATS